MVAFKSIAFSVISVFARNIESLIANRTRCEDVERHFTGNGKEGPQRAREAYLGLGMDHYLDDANFNGEPADGLGEVRRLKHELIAVRQTARACMQENGCANFQATR